MSEQCCCSESAPEVPSRDWGLGAVGTSVGCVPQVPTVLTLRDRLGWWRVRWGSGRGSFRVTPGLYAVGAPDKSSDVFVTANYKMSFDHLRRALAGRNAWIMVLDTHGINVWCAAGKRTFGTEEVVSRISAVKLGEVIDHRKIIVPQLGAPGVSAHVVKKESGFKVVYGPVRANDIPAFLDADMKSSAEMRRVRFDLADRLALVPLELVGPFRYLLGIALVLFLSSGITGLSFAPSRALVLGIPAIMLVVVAWLAAGIVGPVLLPVLPGRSFSVKGAAAGLLVLGILWALKIVAPISVMEMGAWALAVPALSSFIVMNFTGASTYTSPSGVRHEMRMFVPVQAACLVVAAILWIGHLVMYSGASGQ